jgi:hypothetical protein
MSHGLWGEEMQIVTPHWRCAGWDEETSWIEHGRTPFLPAKDYLAATKAEGIVDVKIPRLVRYVYTYHSVWG